MELFIVKECNVPLLGRSWFNPLELFQSGEFSVYKIAPSNAASNRLQLLLKSHDELFAQSLGCIKNFKAHLYIKEGAAPRFFKHRNVPFALLPIIEAELKKLQEQGILNPIKFSEWAAPIVPIFKKDKSVRLCGDYKVGLNPVLTVDQYPLPIIDDILAKLSNGVIFSKLDLAQAYQQVVVDEESAKYLTINTHRGLFQVSRLPFGIASAPAIFQELMDKILVGIPNVVCYLDDILIASPDEDSHFQDLKRVLSRLQEAGIHLNLNKCDFLQPEVEYLGHIINKDGIRAAQRKIKAILDAPEPKNSDQLRSFLGLVNYYRKFLPNLATVLSPLNSLLCKNVRWNWTTGTSDAFKKIKEAITSSDALTHYDPNLSLVVASDASPFGLGAVLSHVCHDGLERPVMFASRTLSPTEKNYSQLDKEALAIMFAVKKFHQFIYGRKFILLTDHKPLTYIFGHNKQIPVLAASRIQRWALALSAYQYELKFRTSKENANADALSRSPCIGVEPSTDEIPEEVFLINQLNSFPWTQLDIAIQTKEDPVLMQVLKYSRNGWPKGPVAPNLVPYRSRALEITNQDGCLLWGDRVLIPAVMRSELLQELHRQHTGIVRMKSLARSLFWWPRLDADIEQLAQNCEDCMLQAKDPPKAVVHPWVTPLGPWNRIHVDFAGPFMGHMFLVTVDAYSKWPEVHVMQKTDSISTVLVLESYFTHFGYPLHIVSDNGAQFTSSEFRLFCRNRGIHHTLTPPYHPATNGLAERFVQVLKDNLRKLKDARPIQLKVDQFLFTYRGTPHSATKKTPAELFLGHPLRGRLQLIKPVIPSSYQPEMTCTARSFTVGQPVLSKSFNKKLPVKWVHGIVRKRYGPVTYLIEFDNGRLGKRHIDQLRRSHLQTRILHENDWHFVQPRHTTTPSLPPLLRESIIIEPQDITDRVMVSPQLITPLDLARYPTRPRRSPDRFTP